AWPAAGRRGRFDGSAVGCARWPELSRLSSTERSEVHDQADTEQGRLPVRARRGARSRSADRLATEGADLSGRGVDDLRSAAGEGFGAGSVRPLLGARDPRPERQGSDAAMDEAASGTQRPAFDFRAGG